MYRPLPGALGFLLVVGVVGVAGFVSADAFAESGNTAIDDRFTIRAGALFNEADLVVTSTRPGEPVSVVDLEELGLDTSQTSPWFNLRWNFAKRWHLDLQYSGFDGDGGTTGTFDFNFEDIVIVGDATVQADMDMSLYIANVGFALINSPRVKASIGLGLHILDLDVAVAGQGLLLGAPIDFGEGTADALAPLPNILGDVQFGLSDNLLLKADIGWFTLDYKDYSGDLVSVRAELEYRMFDRLGLGVGYQMIDMDLEIDKSSKNEVYDMKFDGPFVYLTWGLGG
jgi:hypothetical protein